jgi:hypothetical protein
MKLFNRFSFHMSVPTSTPHQQHTSLTYSFLHSVFCLTTGPSPPPKRFLHIVRSRASSFKWEYPLLYLSSSSSFLRLLPRLLVTYISPFIFPSIYLYILWIKTDHITALVIKSQKLNNFNSHDFNNYPFIAYIYVNLIPNYIILIIMEWWWNR